jgi:protein-disulfide isomerase
VKRSLVFGVLSSLLLVLAVSCAPKDQVQKMDEQMQALEKRIVELEKRPKGPAAPAQPAAQTAAYDLPIGSSHVLGVKNAPVTVTVFSDYECPFCSRVDPFLRDLVKDPDLKAKVNVVFKHFPLSFHQNAKPASKAALAAGEQGSDKFWAMSDKMFQNQRQLSPENFSKWAKEIGLDVTKFNNDLKNNDAKYEAAIKADTDLGVNNAKVRGTPSIYVAGWELRDRSVAGVKSVMQDKKLAQ